MYVYYRNCRVNEYGNNIHVNRIYGNSFKIYLIVASYASEIPNMNLGVAYERAQQ